MTPDAARSDTSAAPNAVQKVCAVLRAMGARSPQRLSELTARTGLNKVTVLRIADTLVAEGFLARDRSGPPGFARGPELLALGAPADHPRDLAELARPSLVRLADLSGDTALLSIRSGAEAVCVDRQEGGFPIRANYLDIGSRRPLGVGAGAMALLAWLPEREREALLDAVGTRLGAFPRLGTDNLRQEAASARERGYALVLDVIVERMGAIGVPLKDAAGRVVGALSIAALSDRIRDREASLRDALLRERDVVGRELARSSASETDTP